MGVANRFLMDIPDMDNDVKNNIAKHMASVHLLVADESKR